MEVQQQDILSGADKAAMLLLVLGEQDAASVLKHLNPEEVHQVGDAMVRIKARGLDSNGCFVSSKTGQGIDDLTLLAEGMLEAGQSPSLYLVPHAKYSLVSRLREQGALLAEEVEEKGVAVTASPRGQLAHQMEEFAQPAS